MSIEDNDRYQDLFAAPNVVATSRQDGGMLLESGIDLPAWSRCVGDWLITWAETRPDQVLFAERDGDGWRRITYGEALIEVLDLAGWILSTPASADKPVMALSENSVDLGLLTLAAMHVGVPIATVSTAYSLMSKDHAKLKAMTGLLDPALVFVSDTATYGAALDAIMPDLDATILASRNSDGRDATLFSEARMPEASSAVSSAFHAVGPDTIARLLFTSGSTGTPKAVINTQRMLTSNQEAHREIWTVLKDKPPVLVDWLPWSHTFGANFSSNMILRNGGSLYIDDGKPAPPLIGKTIANFKDVRPTMALNVPRGFDMLATALQEDAAFRDAFFSMDLAMNAAAALPAGIWETFKRLSRETVGVELPFVGAWGSTETAPLATHCHFPTPNIANIGLPVPGVTLKLVPNGDKLEVRVKGPNVTPGYFRNPEKTAEAFDDEGYYRIGDALRLADPEDPSKGLYFDGRVSEDFKLSSGTWVSVGELRLAGIDALAPLVQDIVVAGHNRDEVGFLLIANEVACRAASGLPGDAPLGSVLASTPVSAAIASGLGNLKSAGGGSSRYAARARFLLVPPNPDTGEITDKAYLNQRQILENREADVDALFGNEAGEFISPA